MDYKYLLDRTRRLVSANKILVKFAVKCRNQANKIIAYSLTQTHLAAENGEQHLLYLLSPAIDTIFDVGANKGEWTSFLKNIKRNQGTYHLFEPGK
ncbi:hypothetical protein BH10BAC3_BH10BAC3_33900 [soil metagenome]